MLYDVRFNYNDAPYNVTDVSPLIVLSTASALALSPLDMPVRRKLCLGPRVDEQKIVEENWSR